MTFRLKAGRHQLWKRLVLRMVEKELKPCSWGYFYYLTMDKKCATLTLILLNLSPVYSTLHLKLI